MNKDMILFLKLELTKLSLCVCAGMPVLFWFSGRMTLWGSISFNLAVFINLIIAFFYPYNSGEKEPSPKWICIKIILLSTYLMYSFCRNMLVFLNWK